MRSVRWRAVTIALLMGCGTDTCTKKNPEYCESQEDCPGQICVDHSCVDVPDGPTDPDADQNNPIVTFRQPADLVLGQPDLDSEGERGCVASAASPTTVVSDGAGLYVREDARNRVLGWIPQPTTNNTNAVLVVGSPQLTDCTPPTMINASNMGVGGHAAVGGGALVVSDTSRNRVLVWNPAPVTNGAPASFVLGVADFFSAGSGDGADDLNCPAGAWTDGTRLVVADACNHRALIWTTFPTTTGEPANLVLGQPAFDVSTAPGAPTSTNLASPVSIWSDGTRLAISDSAQHRVLIWATFPTTNNEPADYVLGQTSFSGGASGLGDNRFNQPDGVAGNEDALFVSDYANNRVMVFAPFPTATGAAATFALGQADFSTLPPPEAASAITLYGPRGLTVADTKLWVADSNHKRTLRYSLYPPP
jgi:hypothetical protein